MTAGQPTRSRFLVSAALFEGGLALVAVAVGWLIGFSPCSRLAFTPDKQLANWLAVRYGLAAAGFMFAGLLVLERIPARSLLRLRVLVRRLVSPLFAGASVVDLAVISLLAGVGEEVLFRGLIQDGLSAAIGGPVGMVIAVAVASAIFGLAHAITRTYALLAALTGVLLGVLHLWTDNLLAPIVAHAVYDFVALLYLTRQTQKTELGKSSGKT